MIVWNGHTNYLNFLISNIQEGVGVGAGKSGKGDWVDFIGFASRSKKAQVVLINVLAISSLHPKVNNFLLIQ